MMDSLMDSFLFAAHLIFGSYDTCGRCSTSYNSAVILDQTDVAWVPMYNAEIPVVNTALLLPAGYTLLGAWMMRDRWCCDTCMLAFT